MIALAVMKAFVYVALIGTLASRSFALTTAFPDATVGTYYTYYLGFASHGGYSMTYRLAAGTLPPGLGLGVTFPDSTLEGLPSTGGIYTFTLEERSCFLSTCTFTLQNRTLTVRPLCAALSKSQDVFGLNGGSGSLRIVAPPSCGWASSGSSGVTLFDLPAGIALSHSSYGAGPAAVTYSIQPSPAGRSETIQIGDNPFTLSQRRTSQVFDDVPPKDPNFDAVNLLRQASITAGCGSSPPRFCPDADVTRGQLAVFLVRSIAGENFTYSQIPAFADVPATHPFFKYIQKLAELKVTAGCSATQYCPDRATTRGEAAVLVIRAKLGASFPVIAPQVNFFTDVPASDPFSGYIQLMVDRGIADRAGCGGGNYCPRNSISRGEAALFVMRGLFDRTLP